MSELKKTEAAKTHEIIFITSNDEKEIRKYGQAVKDGIIIAKPKVKK